MDKQAAYRAITAIKAELITPKPYDRGSEFWNTPPTIRDILSRRARGLWVYILATRDPDVIRAAQSISILDAEGLLAMDLPPQYLDHARVCLGVLREIAAMEVAGDTPMTPPQSDGQLPVEFASVDAQTIWQKAIEAGFIDGHKWLGTRPQLALFAEVAAEKWNLTHKWKPFQEYFSVKNLAQERTKSKDYYGKVKNGDQIEVLFK